MHIQNFVVSGPKFTGLCTLTREESLSIRYFSDFGYIYPFWRYLRSKSEIVRNRANFFTFLVRKLFEGGPQKLRDLDCKIKLTSDHVAKFHGYRSADGDLRSRGEKKHAVKHKTAGYYRTGRPNKSLPSYE